MSTNYKIVVDSTTDMPPSLAEKLGVHVIPYIFTLDGKEYYNHLDYRDISVKEFYNNLRAGKMAQTTQVTSARYVEELEPFLKEGKDILYMCLSSMLSKSYEQSILASTELKEAYPDRKVISIDSKAASIGQCALAYYAARAKEEGKNLVENAAYINKLIPRLHHWVMADDLHHMRRGGRVSGASAFVGTMLSIKPILTMLDDGKLVPLQKVRGRSKALECFLEKISEYKIDQQHDTVFIAHSDVVEFANEVKEKIEEKFGVKNFVINEIGPVIGAHTGPGTIAVIFVSENVRAKGNS